MLFTIPVELREHFNGRKQLRTSTGTSDWGDATQRLHGISAELYARFDACKPDPRDLISDLAGRIGDKDEIQRLENESELEGLIHHRRHLAYGEDSENDVAIRFVNERGSKALDAAGLPQSPVNAHIRLSTRMRWIEGDSHAG